MRILNFMTVLLLFCTAILYPADKQVNVETKHLTASLEVESTTVVAGKPFWVGLQINLEPNWHVYWKNPGDAGLPVSLTWTLPTGYSAGPIHWPYPQRISVPPLMNFGYEGRVLLPVQITPPAHFDGQEKMELMAKAKWVVCQEICLPGSAELSLSLIPAPKGETATLPESNPETLDLFKKMKVALPIATKEWDFSAFNFDSSLILIAKSKASLLATPFHFFPETPGVIENAAPQKFYPIAGGFALELKRIPSDLEQDKAGTGGATDSLMGIVVAKMGWGLPGGEKALEIRIRCEKGKTLPKALATAIFDKEEPPAASPRIGPPLSDSPYPASSASSEKSGLMKLLFMLGLAFTGGLILNLMPCVLPVLSLKIFDFVKRAGQSRWKIFSHGLTFTAGVLVSFWVLAGLLLILRQGGQELGWGFQLQSPGFLMVLCALFFFFSLNLFGVFELGVIFTRIGSTGTQSGHAGSFFAGVTATVVATPCTAPFMGSAMGYAFSQPPYYAMLVFTFLGLGMAAPYLLLSGFPGLMRYLPKPGEWMEHLKQFMGFPLLATAIWLAWVLGHQAGVDALVALLFLLLLAGVSAWVLGKWTALHRTTSVRVLAGLLALVIFLPAFILVLVYLDQIRNIQPNHSALPGTSLANTQESLAWEPFSESRLAFLLDQGKPVFVDFTADWCLSCKVNEKVAFGSTEVTGKFRELGIIALKADWTSRDEAISQALSKYGRNSIPLYVLYPGNGSKDFILLPEVLSPGILLDALKHVPVLATAQVP